VLWYQVDADDSDLSNLVFHLREAAMHVTRSRCAQLPLLTPERLSNVIPFVRRFFEQLAQCLPDQTVLVLDNYQDVDTQAALHAVFAEGLRVAGGLTCVVLSRSVPPPAYSRLRAEQDLSLLNEEALRFTPDEIGDLVRQRTGAEPSPAMVADLHARTLGWAGGLALLLDSGVQAHASEPAHATDAQSTFDYFASEIFSRLDPATRQLLLRTAVLPAVTVEAATALADTPRAARLFEALARDHGFVYRLVGTPARYQLHPLFRHFLLDLAEKQLAPDELAALRRAAAVVLRAEGQQEEATHLFAAAADWASLVDLIVSEAQTLLAQGRQQTLALWLRALPGPVLESNAWLTFYIGLCELLTDPEAARRTLARGYDQFQAAGDLAGQVLAWAAIVDSVVLHWGDFATLDSWIDRAEQDLAPHYDALPPGMLRQRLANGMFAALMYWRTEHPKMPVWAGRLRQQVLEVADVSERILLAVNLHMYYETWKGDVLNARVLLDAVRPANVATLTPLAQILWHFMQGVHNMYRNRLSEAERAVQTALVVAERSAVAAQNTLLYFLGAYINLMGGDIAKVRAHLDAAQAWVTPRRVFEYAHYQFLRACHDYRTQTAAAFLAPAREALRVVDQCGGPLLRANGRLQLAHVLRAGGAAAEAETMATEALALATGIGSYISEYHARLNLADGALARGDTDAANAQLRTAFALAREHRVILPPLPVYPDHWPWPLRIETLGTFQLWRDDRPLRFEGKAQKKPLDLLKALIACGGREVREERLTQALWPEADGDAAHSAFTTTLSRLRKLIGDEALVFSGGRLSLSEQHCWLDVWAFEALLAGTEQPGAVAEPAVAERALALYRGPYLHHECEEPWVLSLRERLNARFVRCLSNQAHRLGERGQWEEAAALYQRGLEADAFIEELHRGLMTAHARLGRRAEALAAFERLRALLKRTFNIEPAAETARLAEAIRAGR
jgi:ATP/maltotriose-dependent transcriptional regulator MalT/DNA-binding SARP family transcriptional activator